jgi:thiol-disulfide isomerase/thioredoxin
MVKKSPDITIVLTKMTWCSHCKDFQEIFNNINSRLGHNKLLKNKEVILETYDMEQSEALFAEKYKDYMSKIDGYPTVFIFVKNTKNKIQGDTIEHTVIEPINNKNKKKLLNNATDMFISKVESKYKSVIDENGNEYVNVEAGMVMGGGGKCKLEAGTDMNGGDGKCKLEAGTVMNGGSDIKTEKDYEQKYKKYKIKYLNLLDKYSK